MQTIHGKAASLTLTYGQNESFFHEHIGPFDLGLVQGRNKGFSRDGTRLFHRKIAFIA